jgi:hypothetical protein
VQWLALSFQGKVGTPCLWGWPGYRVYQFEINEQAKTLRLWVRRKSGNLWKAS